MTSGEPIARFKELCLDTTVASAADSRVGRFWAAVTGGDYVRSGDPGDPGDVVADVEGKGIAICPVPEQKTVKNRAHLDVAVRDVEELTALGAIVVREPDDEITWTVLADPEGNEFCAFVRDQVSSYPVQALVVDAADAGTIAGWWGEVFGVPVGSREGESWRWLDGVPGVPFESLVFLDVPEPKTVKNRLHWDLYGDVEDFRALGARVLWEMRRWTVMADPEGNEFCVFPERPD